MKNKPLFWTILFILFFSAGAYALQASYMYVSLSYGRGWWPWSSVMEKHYRGCPFEDAVMDGVNCLGYDFPACKDITDDLEYGECVQKEAEKGNITLPRMIWPPVWGLVVKITVPEDLRYVDSAGHVLVDEVCRGDTVRLDKSVLKGEYWQDGGHEDSPPIYWVDDVESVFDTLMSYHEVHQTSLEKDILGPGGKPEDGFLDPMLKIPVYTMPVTLHYAGGEAYLTGSFICSLKKKAGDDELIKGGVAIDKNEKIDYMTFSTVYDVECWYFYYGGSGGYSYYPYQVLRVPTVIQAGPKATYLDWGTHNVDFQSKEDFFKVGTIEATKTVKLVDPPVVGIDVSVPGAKDVVPGRNNLLRVLVKNTGAVDVTVRDVTSRSPHELLSCDSENIKPGSQAECIFSINPRHGEAAKLEVDYGYKSCGRDEYAMREIKLIDSIVLSPVLSEQAYSVDVHGACENSYYSCQPVSENVFIGYECQKKAGGFYTPVKESALLKYDLSGIPLNAAIISARTVLNAGEGNIVEVVEAYAGSDELEPVTCEPTGDVCTRPYCQECKKYAEPFGVKVDSVEVNGLGEYSFNVTKALNDAISKNSKTLTVQYRGTQDVWSDQKESSCNTLDAWAHKDTKIDVKKSYMEIIY